MITRKSNTNAEAKFKQVIRDYIPLSVIILAGFILRLYHLGDNCLGFDEVGVSYVTKIQSIGDFVFLVRSHVMAMPLDYAVTWFVSHFGTGNEILRLPPALWGTLTLPVFFILVRVLTSRKTALFSVLLLAIAPFHIQYSQELRFYASLVFFYTLSTLTLWQALKKNNTRSWIVFSTSMVIGLYFHMYILLVLVNAVIFFLAAEGICENLRRVFKPLAVSSIVILAAFAIGFYVFSGRVTFENPLLEYDLSFLQSLAIGLGWLPFYFSSPHPAWVWGVVCCLLEIAGLVSIIKTPRSPAALLLLSAVLQMGLIIAADLFKHYFFSPRQLLPFYPILLMAAGLGISTLTDACRKAMQRILPALNWEAIAITTAALLVLAAGFPSLALYYASPKCNAESITEYIHSTWKPGSTVLVVTPFYGTYYDYFFTDVINAPAIVPSVWQADWDDVNQSKNWPGKTYVIAPLDLAANQQDIIVSSQYKLAPLVYPPSRVTHQLWIRN